MQVVSVAVTVTRPIIGSGDGDFTGDFDGDADGGFDGDFEGDFDGDADFDADADADADFDGDFEADLDADFDEAGLTEAAAVVGSDVGVGPAVGLVSVEAAAGAAVEARAVTRVAVWSAPPEQAVVTVAVRQRVSAVVTSPRLRRMEVVLSRWQVGGE